MRRIHLSLLMLIAKWSSALCIMAGQNSLQVAPQWLRVSAKGFFYALLKLNKFPNLDTQTVLWRGRQGDLREPEI